MKNEQLSLQQYGPTSSQITVMATVNRMFYVRIRVLLTTWSHFVAQQASLRGQLVPPI